MEDSTNNSCAKEQKKLNCRNYRNISFVNMVQNKRVQKFAEDVLSGNQNCQKSKDIYRNYINNAGILYGFAISI